MSVRVMTRIWDNFPGDGPELLAMLAMGDMANDEGHCWPSMATIAKKIRRSRSQAQRVMRSLIEQGFIRVIGNENGGAPGATRRYRIDLARLTGRIDATGSTDATGRTDATGSAGAQDGPHGCAKTGSTYAAQTIIETSGTVIPSAPALSAPRSKVDSGEAKEVASKPGAGAEGSPDGFDEFYAAYPNKKARADAMKAFAKLNPNRELLDRIFMAIEKAKRSDEWLKRRGEFIPYPASWLNGRRWEDEDQTAPQLKACAKWAIDAGFANEFEAMNHACFERNAHEFKNGERIAEVLV